MLTASAEKARDAVQLKGLMFFVRRSAGVQGKDLQNAACNRGQASQVHAIVAKDAFQPMGPPAHVIKINSGNQRAVNVFASRPSQRCGA